MNATPELENTNCCQPSQIRNRLAWRHCWHADGSAAPSQLQAEVVKKFVLSWSEKELAELAIGTPFASSSLSIVTPVTLSKDPTAADTVLVARAIQSTSLPTVSGRAPRAGGYGRGGAVVHGTSCHSVLGYEDLKHPFFRTGVRDMAHAKFPRPAWTAAGRSPAERFAQVPPEWQTAQAGQRR
jgi:hypothetical protein